jgi:hypothetical protein
MWEYLVEALPNYQSQGIGIVRHDSITARDYVMHHLNNRGAERWELVQFAPGMGQVACDIYAPGVIFVFKRPK